MLSNRSKYDEDLVESVVFLISNSGGYIVSRSPSPGARTYQAKWATMCRESRAYNKGTKSQSFFSAIRGPYL